MARPMPAPAPVTSAPRPERSNHWEGGNPAPLTAVMVSKVVCKAPQLSPEDPQV